MYSVLIIPLIAYEAHIHVNNAHLHAVLEIIFIDCIWSNVIPGHTDRTHAGMHGHSN